MTSGFESAPASSLQCIDHLVWACPELQAGVDDASSLLGVTPMQGGRHPDWGSHNALLSLGPETYLEIIAPDPASPLPLDQRPAVFTSPGAGMLNGWVARHPDLDGAIACAEERGFPLGPAIHGRRTLADGRELSWVLTDPRNRHFDGLLPILIDWGTSPHPAANAPEGCHLVDFRLRHPDSDALAAFLEGLGIPMLVEHGESPKIKATIETPSGSVALS